MRFIIIPLSFLLLAACGSVKFEQIYDGYGAVGFHSRGISSNDSLLYVSGAKGKLSVFDLNANAIIDSFSFPAIDFRGVQFVKPHCLLLMNSGNQGLVYQYNLITNELDTVLFQDSAFYDAISVDVEGVGYLMGDPINHQFTVYKTIDNGQHWFGLNNLPIPLKSEAGFAASNTGLAQCKSTVYIGTGGSDTARLLKSTDSGMSWEAINTPLKSGDSFGIYSIAFWSVNDGLIAGGSYLEKAVNDSICFITSNGGKTWKDRSSGLPGYTSCITSSKNGKLIVATGRLGVSYSTNKGKTWHNLTNQPFYSVKIVGDKICLTGQKGTLAIFLKQ